MNSTTPSGWSGRRHIELVIDTGGFDGRPMKNLAVGADPSSKGFAPCIALTKASNWSR
jgi:hypothetical protein